MIKMLCLKKFYSDHLLQLALLLSLLRLDPDAYLSLNPQRVNVGSLDLHNGSGWHTDTRAILQRSVFVHPKNLDSMLLNYEREIIEDLNSLGRYNRLNRLYRRQNDIHAYLLNIDESGRDAAVPGPSVAITTEPSRNVSSPDPPTASSNPDEPIGATDLTQEDMDLIEVLWKQDVDLGFTLVEPTTPTTKIPSSELESEDDIEKLKALEAINASDDKKSEEKTKEEASKEDDPWAGLPYTVDMETGEYILSSGSQSGCATSSVESSEHLLSEPSLGLESHDLVGLSDDSLGLSDTLGPENDFTSDLLGEGLLGSASVEGLLSTDSLGLPDGFNLEEALQFVGLDEADPEEEKSDVKKKSDEKELEGSRSTSPNSSPEEDDVGKSTDTDNMIHTPQFHHPHPHHPHHRSYQGRMPLVRAMSVEQRWQDLASFLPLSSTDHFTAPSHPGYPGHGVGHSHYENQRNVLLHNVSLAPPLGDLNPTGPYHNVGGPSNLGSAVATSMNLNEPLGAENGGAYKSEPNDMMYYHTQSSEAMNQATDGFLSSLLNENDLGFMDVMDGSGMYNMRMMENNTTNNVSGPPGAAALPGVQAGATTPTAAGVTTLTGVTDERMDASSDSAVSSMGSERVPSLSDGEWMETGSNSSHTQADSHYSMDYAGKYHMQYGCSYTIPGRNGASPRCQGERGMAPVAQKKHQMFAKRYFQEQGTGSPLGSSSHPAPSMKYEYDSHSVASGAPGNAYSGPIEGAAGPQPEIKYSCSLDFSRHQSGRSLQHVQHNHTYHLPIESSGVLQRPVSRDKKARKGEAEEHLTRDEKRARALNVPITVSDIINLPMDEFNERLSKYDLSEAQLSLIRDIRRRGKNKVAAQNCRKRKLDQIMNLADQVKEMRDRKTRLIREREYMLSERQRVKDKFSQLYHHVFGFLRDSDGNQYQLRDWSLQQSADGNVVLVPRNQSCTYQPRSSMEPKTKPDQEHKE